jgi:hypothetical protein
MLENGKAINLYSVENRGWPNSFGIAPCIRAYVWFVNITTDGQTLEQKERLSVLCLPSVAVVSFRSLPNESQFTMVKVGIRQSEQNSLRTTEFILTFRSQLKLSFNVKFALGSADGSQTLQEMVCLLCIDEVGHN